MFGTWVLGFLLYAFPSPFSIFQLPSFLQSGQRPGTVPFLSLSTVAALFTKRYHPPTLPLTISGPGPFPPPRLEGSAVRATAFPTVPHSSPNLCVLYASVVRFPSSLFRSCGLSTVDCQLPFSFPSSPHSANLGALCASALSFAFPKLSAVDCRLSTSPKSFHHVSYAKSGGYPPTKQGVPK